MPNWDDGSYPLHCEPGPEKRCQQCTAIQGINIKNASVFDIFLFYYYTFSGGNIYVTGAHPAFFAVRVGKFFVGGGRLRICFTAIFSIPSIFKYGNSQAFKKI